MIVYSNHSRSTDTFIKHHQIRRFALSTRAACFQGRLVEVHKAWTAGALYNHIMALEAHSQSSAGQI